MDSEFHYYITGILACEAGFPEQDAYRIAYASQLVDDNTRVLEVQGGEEPYANFISQTMDITRPGVEWERIFTVFHFIPGDPLAASAQRRDGKMHILNTTPDSSLANRFLDEALASSGILRLYRIGIAVHGFADTWAHQNFVGWKENFNQLEFNPLPNIGHADYLHHPDWVAHRWEDPRLVVKDVDNNQRFLDAARRIFEKLCGALESGRADRWPSLKRALEDAMGLAVKGKKLEGGERRLHRYQKLMPSLPVYDPHTWRDEAIHTHQRGLADDLPGPTLFKDWHEWRTDMPKYDQSDWWRFQEAVKAHQLFCMEALAPVFQQMGVDIWQH